MVLVWRPERHYFAVKPSRPVVIIGAFPVWFGIFALQLGVFAGAFTWVFTSDWGVWAAEFVPPIAIWGIVGITGLMAGPVGRRRTRRTSRRSRS